MSFDSSPREESFLSTEDVIIIESLNLNTLSGLDEWGRQLKRQPIFVSLFVYSHVDPAGSNDNLSSTLNYGTLCKKVSSFTESSSFKSMEGLALGIAQVVVLNCGAQRVKVRIEKPKGHLYAEGAGVEIIRSQSQLLQEKEILSTLSTLSTSASTSSVPPSPASSLSNQLNTSSITNMNDLNSSGDHIFLRNLTLHAIIGCNVWERVK